MLRRLEIVGPLAVVAVLFGVVIGNRLTTYQGNVTGFILIGSHFRHDVDAPRGARSVRRLATTVSSSTCRRPTRSSSRTGRCAASSERARCSACSGWRIRRIAYLAAAGQRSAFPWSMLAINVAVVLLATGGFRGVRAPARMVGLVGAVVGLLAGFLSGTVRDLSDPLAVASVLGGLIAWQSRPPMGGRGRCWRSPRSRGSR